MIQGQLYRFQAFFEDFEVHSQFDEAHHVKVLIVRVNKMTISCHLKGLRKALNL